MIKAITDTIQGKAPSFKVKRSNQWPAVRKKFLETHKKCAICEGTKKLEVHHIKPFHLHPELELDPANLIVLCEDWSYGINCHLLVGHLGNYKNVNDTVLEDSRTWTKKIKHQSVCATLHPHQESDTDESISPNI